MIGAVCDERVGALDSAFASATIMEPFLYIAEFDRAVNRFSAIRRLLHGAIPAEVVIYSTYYFVCHIK